MESRFNKATYFTNNEGFWLALNVKAPDGMQFLNSIKDREYLLSIKEYREKRSLNANAYMWVLVNEIANVLRADKEEIYLQMLKKYGQTGSAKINNDYVDNFKRMFKYCEIEPRLSDEDYTHFRFWIGSSNYNTKEMSVLIDGVVEEAKQLGIEIMTPDEIENLKSMWCEDD